MRRLGYTLRQRLCALRGHAWTLHSVDQTRLGDQGQLRVWWVNQQCSKCYRASMVMHLKEARGESTDAD